MTSTSTQKVIFHNNGIISDVAWTMHGVSAKDDPDTAVGRFGTGACYFIAVFLRTGHKVSIKAEDKLYEFGLMDMEFRGREFQRVTCNGQPLSFTTHYGVNWTVDQAYREVYANCIDEGGIHFVGEPLDEGTSVIIEGEGVLDSMSRHDEIFVGSREPIAETPKGIRIYQGAGTIFYRGVKVDTVQNALFSYELLGTIELTEDRSVKYQYQIGQIIGREITRNLKDKALIRRFCLTVNGQWEHDIDYDWSDWSDEFTEVVKDLYKNNPTGLNKRIFRLVRQKCTDIGWEPVERTEDQELMLEKAMGFLARAGYPVNAPVVIVGNEDQNNIAFVFNGSIHLTEKAFAKGVFYLTTTLLEENFHIAGFDDFCRSFQSHLIDEIVKQSCKRLREAL